MNAVLIVNMGSSSLKWLVMDAAREAIQQQGEAHWTGQDGGRHQRELEAAFEQVGDVDAVGHRVVHGGPNFTSGVLIDETVRKQLDDLADLAPLHNPAALAGIDAASARFPGVPQIATFDTAFHASLPAAARTYAVPWAWTNDWHVRKFGFHGLSVAYAVERSSEFVGGLPRRLVVCHLGAGCSITAALDGRSIETSMGFTPLDGLMMAQRSGSVDPGLLLYLMTRHAIAPKEVERALNAESGLLGVSGVSADLRQVQAAAERGDARARLAVDMFVHRVISTVGAMVAVLGGLDALVFTGGIGEHSAPIRAAVARAFDYVGLQLDGERNERVGADVDIATRDSTVRVLVIAAREDLSILREVKRVLN